MTFKQALRIAPMEIVAAFDPWQHTTVEDLRWLALHELDLDEEGDVPLTEARRKALRRFRERTEA